MPTQKLTCSTAEKPKVMPKSGLPLRKLELQCGTANRGLWMNMYFSVNLNKFIKDLTEASGQFKHIITITQSVHAWRCIFLAESTDILANFFCIETFRPSMLGWAKEQTLFSTIAPDHKVDGVEVRQRRWPNNLKLSSFTSILMLVEPLGAMPVRTPLTWSCSAYHSQASWRGPSHHQWASWSSSRCSLFMPGWAEGRSNTPCLFTSILFLWNRLFK